MATIFKPTSARNSRWFYIVLAVAALFFIQALREKNRSYEAMVVQLHQLEKERDEALTLKKDLLLQVQSQTDPAWVEMVLKRNLGMVREGQVKVYFHAD